MQPSAWQPANYDTSIIYQCMHCLIANSCLIVDEFCIIELFTPLIKLVKSAAGQN